MSVLFVGDPSRNGTRMSSRDVTLIIWSVIGFGVVACFALSALRPRYAGDSRREHRCFRVFALAAGGRDARLDVARLAPLRTLRSR